MNENKQELLELYKLHATLTDNVTKNRGRTNAFFLSLLTGSIFLYMRLSDVLDNVLKSNAEFLIISGAGLGILLSVIWIFMIHRYRKLNKAKFQCLIELEQQLSYNFFEKEWQIYKSKVRGAEVTQIEYALPVLFALFFLFAALFFGAEYANTL